MPTYSYKMKVVGFLLLILSLSYSLSSKVFDFSLVKNDDISLWVIAFSLLIISFSRDKKQAENIILIKYYSGKITASFIFSFILAMKLAEFVIGKKLPIETLLLVIIALIIYQISYNIIKRIGQNNSITLVEKNVFETFVNNKKLYFISIIIAIITLIIIAWIK